MTHMSRAWQMILAATIIAALGLAAVGCGDGTTSSSTGADSDGVLVAMSDLARLAPAAPPADLDSAAASLQAFGGDLYAVLAKEAGNGNLVFSPSSIMTALAMVYAGADGATAEEIENTLRFTLKGEALHQALNSLDQAIESRSFTQKDREGHDIGVLVRTANSLWGQKGFAFEQPFLDTLATDYGAGMRLVDFEKAVEEARVAINGWVAEQTADKIPELLEQGTLDDFTRLVLVNAIYLDATWLSEFQPTNTAPGEFTTADGTTVTAEMMTQTFSYPYAEGEGWQAVELPYLGERLAMLVIVPDQGGLAEVEGHIGLPPGENILDQAVASLQEGEPVILTLPKFKFRTQAGLAGALAALGMPTAFGLEADFSRMTTEERLFISDVIHEAFIAVDEEGTEAAAATAALMTAGAFMERPLELKVDRPFLFAIRDRDTGAVLFMGRVTDPTK